MQKLKHLFYNVIMQANDLLEPELLYKRELKDKHHQSVVDLFDELTKKSGVNVEANQELCSRIYAKQRESQRLRQKLEKTGGLRGLFIFLIVLGAILSIVSIPLFMYQLILAGILFLLFGIGTVVGGILLLVKVYKPKARAIEIELDKVNKEVEKMISEAYAQMQPLVCLFDEEMPAQLFHKTAPLVEMDRIFDTKKLEFLIEKYGYKDKDKENVSKIGIQSGSILGNPFAFFKELEMNMLPHVYEGTLVISWTTTVPTKDGFRTVHHTQTLRATVTKPKPNYSLDTYLMYANEAAPNLTFSRRPSNINTMDDKEIEKYVRKHEKDLYKLAEKEMGKGGTYTPVGNSEFELFFGGLNRNNEVEYRLLFTPLAQKSMLSLLKSKEGYGDDFNLVKSHMINLLNSIHSTGDAIFVDVTRFYDFDYEKIKEKFIDYNDYYFKAIFFDLAPLLCIPLYQQHKAHEYIYKGTIKSNFTSYEHEVMVNRHDISSLVDPESDTQAILKTNVISNKDGIDTLQVVAHSFKSVKHVEIVPKLGGDGRMHGVPVTWYEYIPLEKESTIAMTSIGGDRVKFNKIGNNSMIFNRGLVSYNQEQPLNISIKELKSLMAKE